MKWKREGAKMRAAPNEKYCAEASVLVQRSRIKYVNEYSSCMWPKK